MTLNNNETYTLNRIKNNSTFKVLWIFLILIVPQVIPISILSTGEGLDWEEVVINHGWFSALVLSYIFVIAFFVLIISQIVYKIKCEIFFRKTKDVNLSDKKIRWAIWKGRKYKISEKIKSFFKANSIIVMLIIKKRNYYLFSFFQTLCFVSFLMCFIILFNIPTMSWLTKEIYALLIFPIGMFFLSLFIVLAWYYLYFEQLRFNKSLLEIGRPLMIFNSRFSEVIINKFYSFVNNQIFMDKNILDEPLILDIKEQKNELLRWRLQFFYFTKVSFFIHRFICAAFASTYFASIFIDLGTTTLLPWVNIAIIFFALTLWLNLERIYNTQFKKTEEKFCDSVKIINVNDVFNIFNKFYDFYTIYFVLVSNQEIIYNLDWHEKKSVELEIKEEGVFHFIVDRATLSLVEVISFINKNLVMLINKSYISNTNYFLGMHTQQT